MNDNDIIMPRPIYEESKIWIVVIVVIVIVLLMLVIWYLLRSAPQPPNKKLPQNTQKKKVNANNANGNLLQEIKNSCQKEPDRILVPIKGITIDNPQVLHTTIDINQSPSFSYTEKNTDTNQYVVEKTDDNHVPEKAPDANKSEEPTQLQIKNINTSTEEDKQISELLSNKFDF